MQTRTVEQVESWSARPFSGGFHELHELSDTEFSGAVVADDTWLFFLNGRVVGVFQGDIDDVDDASGTIYQAPDPSLPLLFSMQERGGTTQAKYFTNDTSVAEADETLRDANFTGYLELSENVLSGDYYVSYYGGKSMSTAFVGQSERLITGEEAFERTNDEVGVFEVRKVSMNITEIPSPPNDGSAGGTTAGAAAGATTDSQSAPAADGTIESAESSDTETASNVEEDAAEPTDQADGEQSAGVPDAGESASQAEAGQSAGSSVSDESADAADSGAGEVDRSRVESGAGSETSDRPAAVEEAEHGSTNDQAGTDEGPDPDSTKRPSGGEQESSPDESVPSGAGDSRPREESAMSDHERAVREWAAKDRSDADPSDQNLFREEAEWRKTKSIPALDPDESAEGRSPSDQSSEPSGRRNNRSPTSRDTDGARQADTSTETKKRAEKSRESTDRSGRQTGATKRLKKLKAAVEARDRRIETLESELSSAQSSREELEETVTDLREERSDLQSRIETLESELQSAKQTGGGGAESAATDIPADEALSGTNLFVRYESKGQPTLSSLEEGAVDPSAVNDNLRLEHHTQFDLADATVDGRAFESFLHDSSRYRFVDWLVRELPYELLDSGATSELQDVYEAVPNFDRIEFDGTVDVQTESGDATTHDFDVVIRDRMGEPLVVAEINDSRDPVRDEAMADLLSGASSIGESVESLAGAFYVTASFFEPGALEQAKEASSEGGFFSRTDRESYVKVSRKRGYHLCLVEDRHDAFHLTVPEL